jgi:hypothetical protein
MEPAPQRRKGFPDFANGPWPSRLACVTRIVLPGDESPVPSQQRIWRDKGCKLVECFAADPFGFGGQARPLSVIKPGLFIQLLPEHADFLSEILDDLLLITVHPASDTD